MDISFIIPVFNTKLDDLERCFKSILELKHLSYEAIIVDDGSKESVADFCRSFCDQNENFDYVRKQNEGVSAARNKGILESKGDYISFVDSDDEIISSAYDSIELTRGADVIVYDMLHVIGGKESVWSSFECDTGEIPVDDFLYRLVSTKKLNSPCAKLFKRRFLVEKEICFDTKMIMGEDALFIAELAERSPSIYYKKNPSYRYLQDIGTVKKRTLNNAHVMVENSKTLYNKRKKILLQFLDLSKEEKILVNNIISDFFVSFLFSIIAEMCQSRKLDISVQSYVQQTVRCIDEKEAKSLHFTIKMKYYIIRQGMWRLMYALSLLRDVYVKIKY